MVLQELIQNYFMLNRLAYQEKRNKEKLYPSQTKWVSERSELTHIVLWKV